MRVAPRQSEPLGLPRLLLFGLALLCTIAPPLLAEDNQKKAMPPCVERVLRWLPEDTETLFVARSVTLPNLDAAQDWQDVGMGLAWEDLFMDRGRQFKDYDVRLIASVKDVSDVPTGCKSLIIVAAVDHVLHFRIFDGDGKQVADTNERRLKEQAVQIEALRKQLRGLWPPHRLKASERETLIRSVTSIVDHAQLNPLGGRKIECVVRGAGISMASVVSASLRSESCTIVVFDKDLGDAAGEWTERLRKGAKAVRTILGREVFVFPSTKVMESWVKETRWQGSYFVLLKPNIVLCASSDRYLEAVLRRVNEVPAARALPDNLPEWKQVDFDAPVWMLRHIPKIGGRAHTVGSTATFMRNGFRVAYIPRIGSDVNIKQIDKEWFRTGTPILRDQLKTVRQPDGTVVLSCSAKLGDETGWFVFQLYWLQAFELSQAGE